MRKMAFTQRRFFCRSVEAIQCQVPHRLQQMKARLRAGTRIGNHQRLVDQRGERAQHFPFARVWFRTDLLRGAHVETA